jgi:alcohol dehydrogenase
MKALIYHGPGQKHWEEKPDPAVENPTDAVVRILHTTICGTDLHILKGDVPAVKPGRVLGHEGVGIVEATGSAVRHFRPGDHVLISCITSCGSCPQCRKQMYSHCEDGGWILGHLIDGTQAEQVRIPHADHSLYPVPPGASEEALVMLSDILPTGFEIGVLYGKVAPGDTVAVVGAGPVGMAALLTAQFFGPSRLIMVDMDENRLAAARQFGATDTVPAGMQDPAKAVMELTGGKGVDVAIEAVGVPATFSICQRILAPGARLANVGVHGKPVDLQLQDLWIRNISISTGLVNTNTTPMLLNVVQSGKIDPSRLITHRFSLAEIEAAYEVFANAAQEKALKVVLSA